MPPQMQTAIKHTAGETCPGRHIYSGYRKYSDPLKFFTLCYFAAIC